MKLRLLLALCCLLSPSEARATAGLAEYSWSFPDRPGQWIEFHHGDICPPGAAHKDCVIVRRPRASGGERESPAPYDASPRALFTATLLALVSPAFVCLALVRLGRAWPDRAAAHAGGRSRSLVLWGVALVVALAWLPGSLATLFPASPSADGWPDVIALSLNLPIVISPLLLWWAFRRLRPPSGRPRASGWARPVLWLVLIGSAALAPFVLFGPPNLILFLFPPALAPNVAISLVAVWALSKTVDAIRRATGLAERSDTELAP